MQEQGKRAKLILNIDEGGHGSIKLDGMDLGQYVSAVEIHASSDGLTKVGLTLVVGVEGEIVASLEQIALAKPAQQIPPPASQEPDFVQLADGRRIPVRRKSAA